MLYATNTNPIVFRIKKIFFLLPKRGFLGTSFARTFTRILPSVCINISQKLSQLAEKLSDWHLNVKNLEKEIVWEKYKYILVEDFYLLPLSFRIRKRCLFSF